MHIDDLVYATKMNPTTDNIIALWKDVFVRKCWYLLPANDGYTQPLVIDNEDRIGLPIFTSYEKMEAFADKRELKAAGEPLKMLVLSPYDAMLKILKTKDSIDEVIFNAGGKHGFRVTPAILEQYADYFNVLAFEPDKGSDSGS